jgi:hypothetical protein
MLRGHLYITDRQKSQKLRRHPQREHGHCKPKTKLTLVDAVSMDYRKSLLIPETDCWQSRNWLLSKIPETDVKIPETDIYLKSQKPTAVETKFWYDLWTESGLGNNSPTGDDGPSVVDNVGGWGGAARWMPRMRRRIQGSNKFGALGEQDGALHS